MYNTNIKYMYNTNIKYMYNTNIKYMKVTFNIAHKYDNK